MFKVLVYAYFQRFVSTVGGFYCRINVPHYHGTIKLSHVKHNQLGKNECIVLHKTTRVSEKKRIFSLKIAL